jgi:DNA polymerase III epsilon subunit family exonuclease
MKSQRLQAFPDTFAIIDTETTGMRPPYSRVVDVGIIRIEQGLVVDRFETLLNPGTYIPSSISRFTGITDSDVATAPQFEDVALRVRELLAGAVFVAHNASFDYNFIASEFKRIGCRARSILHIDTTISTLSSSDLTFALVTGIGRCRTQKRCWHFSKQ